MNMNMNMQMDIQSQGFTLTDALRDYLLKRLAYDLNHGDEYISRVSVRLSDINGPRGGADKRCFIEIRLKQLPAVVIEDTEADLYVAIDRAVERASRTLTRRMERQRGFAPGMAAETENADWGAEADAQSCAPHS